MFAHGVGAVAEARVQQLTGTSRLLSTRAVMTRRYDYPPACNDHCAAIFVAIRPAAAAGARLRSAHRQHAAEEPYKSDLLIVSLHRLQQQADRDARPT